MLSVCVYSNLKNSLQITSSRVKQLVQKLASTLANRYENWCVTNFAGNFFFRSIATAAKIRKANALKKGHYF